MSDISANAMLITVHGRESLSIPYKNYAKNSQGRETQIDISAWDIYFEVPTANIRKKLVADPGDLKGLLVYLTREEVVTLSTTASAFACINETNPLFPDVEWEGKIQRVGYVGAP